jgi:chemotaxis protein methyltransferase WspC
MRRKALDKLDRLLAPAGIIFLSPVEQPLAIQHGFAMAPVPRASACCKPGHGPRPQRPPGPPKRSDPTPNKPLLDGELRPQPLTGPKELPPPLAAPSPSSDLEAARRLADAGRLNQAAQICETHLRQNPASAQAHYLLGLLREATGQPDAIDSYRKALYLEPNHYESLLQMALLLQKNGDVERARAFKTRAQRVKIKT